MRSLLTRLLAISILLAPYTSLSANDKLADFDAARDMFWRWLYPGGWTLYCGIRFDQGRTEDGGVVEIDHIYPMSRVYQHLGCGSRLRCSQAADTDYHLIESDLHNMYPAWQPIAIYREDTVFGELDNGHRRFPNCDISRQQRIIQPRAIAIGNIARTLLYMHTQYGLPLEEDLEMLKHWNRVNPPSSQEHTRNRVIERLQGTRNPFVDNPELVEDL